eukprot:799210-Pyramimonas_sp.AAC.1
MVLLMPMPVLLLILLEMLVVLLVVLVTSHRYKNGGFEVRIPDSDFRLEEIDPARVRASVVSGSPHAERLLGSLGGDPRLQDFAIIPGNRSRNNISACVCTRVRTGPPWQRARTPPPASTSLG